MERVKTVERKWFTKDEKYYILSKSHGKCCHCGKPIKVGVDFTVEHVIPISKGGTNDITNVVALCKECNDNKADYIIFPYEYFKYLDREFLNELYDNQIEYYKNTNWFNITNFLPEDKFEINIEMSLDSLASKRKSLRHRGKQFKDMYIQRNMLAKYVASKAVYSDLDEIYKYVIKYNDKHGIQYTKETLKDLMMSIFEKGAFYQVKNSSQEIVLVVPVALSGFGVNADRICAIRVMNPMCMYNKQHYYEVLKKLLSIIFGGILSIPVDKDLEYRPILLECVTTDKVSEAYFDSAGGYDYLCEADDDECGKIKSGIVVIRDKAEQGSEYTLSLYDALVTMSKSILKNLDLKLEDIILGVV